MRFLLIPAALLAGALTVLLFTDRPQGTSPATSESRPADVGSSAASAPPTPDTSSIATQPFAPPGPGSEATRPGPQAQESPKSPDSVSHSDPNTAAFWSGVADRLQLAGVSGSAADFAPAMEATRKRELWMLLEPILREAEEERFQRGRALTSNARRAYAADASLGQVVAPAEAKRLRKLSPGTVMVMSQGDQRVVIDVAGVPLDHTTSERVQAHDGELARLRSDLLGVLDLFRKP